MAIERHFLGWDAPALPRAAAWLGQRYARGGDLDLSNCTAVTPTSRAGRRLLELLADEAQAGGLLFVPPRMETVGRLPEVLCRFEQPIAGDLQAMLARVQALRSADPQTLSVMFPHPPATDDFTGWWNLAADVHRLVEDLGSGGLRLAEVSRRAREQGFDFRHESRFGVLAELEQAYHRTLEAQGLRDRQDARLEAIDQRRCRCDTHLLLIAVADLSPMAQAMLHAAGRQQPGKKAGEAQAGDVTALIHAPEAHAHGFDEMGGLRIDHWRKQRVDLSHDMLRFVDRPADQVHEVVEAVGGGLGGANRYTADAGSASNSDERAAFVDQVTVGLGDQAMAGAVQRALETANLPARFGPGRALWRSRPMMYLSTLARFAAYHRFDDLAQLLRHPDVEAFVARDAEGLAAAAHWLTLLDRYAGEHLQGRVDGRWLGDEQQQARLKYLWQRVLTLLPHNAEQRRPLCRWSRPLAGTLTRIYGKLQLTPASPVDQRLIRALETLTGALREQMELDAHAATTPSVTAAQAMRITHDRLSEMNIPDADGSPAVELMGYLELQLDDAPRLVITSMNEHAIPGSHTADPLLPDSLRSALGLADNARRYARDLMMLQAIVHSRPTVTLIAGRRSAQGEPLAPSRLLLACGDEALVERVRRFYQSGEEAPSAREASRDTPLTLTPGKTDGADDFLVPPPLLEEPVLDRLPVTAFRDYIACPYRFYLKHVRKLRTIDDQVVEMDALTFGSLAHEVLQAFGKSETTHATDVDEIEAFLSCELNRLADARFGGEPRPALRIQIEQLRERLQAFARRQAQWAEEGWRIAAAGVEHGLQATLTIDQQPFIITGRVDRIDQHPDHGYRILDYKTGDSPKRPEQAHGPRRAKQQEWNDLQLPLYRDLCAPPPLEVKGRVELGYINLCKNLDKVGLTLAEWSEGELDQVTEKRDEVIRDIRRQRFWPPAQPPRWSDDFTDICADAAVNRREVLDRSREKMNHVSGSNGR